jgi:hypothetical protein
MPRHFSTYFHSRYTYRKALYVIKYSDISAYSLVGKSN